MIKTVSKTARSSNDLWIADISMLDILLLDEEGQIAGRPTLTIIIDAFSHCVAGFHLSLEKFGTQHLVSALRHAILQKSYAFEYGIETSWVVYGAPRELQIDHGKGLQSKVFTNLVEKLNIQCSLRYKPTSSGMLERFLRGMNTEFCLILPGSSVTGHSHVSDDMNQSAFLTLPELEKNLVRYICDHYNQQPNSREGSICSRNQKWLSGFEGTLPEVVEGC